MRRFLGWSVAVLALAAVVGLIAKGGGTADQAAGPAYAPMEASGGVQASDEATARKAATYGEASGAELGVSAGAPAPMPSPATDGDFLAVSQDSGGLTLPAIAEPGVDPKVIKTASMEVELADGTFDKAFRDASLVAVQHGGYIQSSSTSRFDEARTASLVVRVPAARFDPALAAFRELGDVVAEDASGEDVSAQFVDLQARLRNWEAQESVLLRLMSEANTIDESIKVQRNLSDVQLNIERLRGQLRLLRDQTDLGTIGLTLTEGDQSALVEKQEDDSILGKAWRDAVDGFQNVLAATVIGLGYLIPIALLVLIVGFVVRRTRRAPAVAES
jgi:hypothetical protein